MPQWMTILAVYSFFYAQEWLICHLYCPVLYVHKTIRINTVKFVLNGAELICARRRGREEGSNRSAIQNELNSNASMSA